MVLTDKEQSGKKGFDEIHGMESKRLFLVHTCVWVTVITVHKFVWSFFLKYITVQNEFTKKKIFTSNTIIKYGMTI